MLFSGDAGPHALLLGLVLLTFVPGQLISNMATALIVLPVAVSAADELDVSAKPVHDGRRGGVGGGIPDTRRDAGEPDGDGAGRLPVRRLLEARAPDAGALRPRRGAPRPRRLVFLTVVLE